jgi:vanillate O-demethylase monooxygenase subunit
MKVRDSWYAIGWEHEFPPMKLVERTLMGQPIVIWKGGSGHLVAFDNRCLHKQFPLSRGVLVDGLLQCRYHGFCYDEEGRCARIPSLTDGETSPAGRALKSFPVTVNQGVAWLWPGKPDHAAKTAPPATPRLASPDFDVYYGNNIEFTADPQLLIENLVDLTHFFPLHSSTLGNVANSSVPIDVNTGDEKIVVTRFVEDYTCPPGYIENYGMTVADRQHVVTVENVSLTTVQMLLAKPGGLGKPGEIDVMFHHMICPSSEKAATWRWACSTPVSARIKGNSLAERVGKQAIGIVEEDRWALQEQQRMLDFESSGTSEIAIRADRGVFAVRRLVRQLERDEVS